MSLLKSHQAAALGLDVPAGTREWWVTGRGSQLGCLVSCPELAEPLVKKTVPRFSCCVFGFGLVFLSSRELSSSGCKAVCQWPGLAKQGRKCFVLVTGDTSHQGNFPSDPQ